MKLSRESASHILCSDNVEGESYFASLVQPEADLDRHLPVCNLAVVEVTF